MRLPAAFHLDAELPAPLAERGAGEGVVAAGAGAQLDAGEAVRGVLLPVPVVRQAAEQRLLGRLRRRAPFFVRLAMALPKYPRAPIYLIPPSGAWSKCAIEFA